MLVAIGTVIKYAKSFLQVIFYVYFDFFQIDIFKLCNQEGNLGNLKDEVPETREIEGQAINQLVIRIFIEKNNTWEF